jgi:hypothetical protein
MLPKVIIKRMQPIETYKISNFISAEIKKYLKTKSKVDFRITECYKEAVGEEIYSVSSILKCENGELVVKIKNAVWKTELKFREEEIKKIINLSKNDNLTVNKIIFK